jgi:hypothetical protein
MEPELSRAIRTTIGCRTEVGSHSARICKKFLAPSTNVDPVSRREESLKEGPLDELVDLTDGFAVSQA